LRYNIAPSQQVPVIVRNEERNILKPMRWGLMPSWTDDKAIWQRLINARAETLGKDHRTSGSFQRSVV
jgi:putative SOS response-associated peptidase YedK